jgi:hypothetical protein
MPSATGVAQAGSGLGAFSTSIRGISYLNNHLPGCCLDLNTVDFNFNFVRTICPGVASISTPLTSILTLSELMRLSAQLTAIADHRHAASA